MGEAGTRGGGVDHRLDDGDLSDWSQTDEDEDPSLSDDDMFEVLANRRRRQAISHLREADGTVTVGELAERIAAAENDTTVKELSSYERKRVYISLYQNHLPVMDEANVVEYVEHRKTVELLDAATKLESYIDDDAKSTDRRWTVAAALLAASIVLLGSSQIGFFGLVPVTGWTLFGVVGLVGIALTEARRASTT